MNVVRETKEWTPRPVDDGPGRLELMKQLLAKETPCPKTKP